MGYMKHHAIIVTSWDEKYLKPAHDKAVDLFYPIADVTEMTSPAMNGFTSFMVAPDGSKEGWDHSDRGDRARDEFVQWLRDQAYDDGSSAYGWVEVQFDDDEGHDAIVRSSS